MSKSTYRYRICYLGLLLLISSCSGLRYLNEGEKILSHQTVEGVGPIMQSHISTLHEQEPNSRLFEFNKNLKGPAHLVYIYEAGKKRMDTAKVLTKQQALEMKYDAKIEKAKREKRKRRLTNKKIQKTGRQERIIKEGNLFMRWGEPLTIYDSSKTYVTKEKIEQYMDTWGYFDKKVTVEEKYLNKDSTKVHVVYNIEKNIQSSIDSVQYEIPDPAVYELYMDNIDDSELYPRLYRQIDLTAERDRIYNMMVNNGYYTFSKDLVLFEVDSVSLGERELIVRLMISNPPNVNKHKKYQIDSVIFVTDAGLNVRPTDTLEFRDVTYTYGRYKYSPKVLDWKNYLYPNQVYKRDNTFETQRHLAYLDNFKFINVNYDTSGGKFIAHVFTKPSERFQTSSEVGFSVNSGGRFPGPFLSLNLRNRNTFGGLEVVDINGNLKLVALEAVINDSTEVSNDGRSRPYSSVQYGADLSVTFPQFLVPFGRFYKKKIARFNPNTRLSFSLNREERLTEYERTIFNTRFGYQWKVTDEIGFVVTPVDVSFVNSVTTASFQSILDEFERQGNSYARSFNSAFVSSGSFELNVNNNYGVDRGAYFFQGRAEFGGNLLSLLGDNPFGSDLEYYQYFKTSLDFRKSFQINKRADLVTRLKVGFALPYASPGLDGFNRRALPYERYFFAGGSVGNRAWRPRRLGPGSFAVRDDAIDNVLEKVDYTLERPGDMTIEANLEVRQDLIGFVNWALFLDIGNVWLIRSETLNLQSGDPENANSIVDDGIFRFNDFPKELAIGMGWGLRFDLSFLIFRVDVGYKIYDPAQAPTERWVAWDNDIINFTDKFPWVDVSLFKNAEINIGIGYPF